MGTWDKNKKEIRNKCHKLFLKQLIALPPIKFFVILIKSLI